MAREDLCGAASIRALRIPGWRPFTLLGRIDSRGALESAYAELLRSVRLLGVSIAGFYTGEVEQRSLKLYRERLLARLEAESAFAPPARLTTTGMVRGPPVCTCRAPRVLARNQRRRPPLEISFLP